MRNRRIRRRWIDLAKLVSLMALFAQLAYGPQVVSSPPDGRPTTPRGHDESP